MAEEYTDFPIEFHVDPEVDDDTEKTLYVEAEDRLRKLAANHTDITGAAIDITQPAEQRETDFIFEASIVVYTRPNNVAAVEKHSDMQTALRAAVKEVERQIRDKRDRLRKY